MTTNGGTQSLEAWALVRQMLDDMVAMVQEDAETELELLEGLRVARPRHGAVLGALARHRPRQAVVLQHEHRGPLRRRAEPRRRVPAGDDRRHPPLPGDRHAGHHRVPRLPGAGRARASPRDAWPRTCATATWRSTPTGGSGSCSPPPSRASPSWRAWPGWRSRTTRRRSWCASTSQTEQRRRRPRWPSSRSTRTSPPAAPTDASLAGQLTGMAWTIAKLATLHRTIKPRAARAAERARHRGGGRARRRRHDAGQPLHDRHVPPRARRGAGARHRSTGHPLLERDAREHLARVHRPPPSPQLDHERCCGGGARRHGSAWWSPAPIRVTPTGSTSAGRHRGFVLLRWLDNPERPPGDRPAWSPLRRRELDDPRRAVRPRPAAGEAVAAAGCDDLGEHTWQDGLDRLLEGFVDEARLHELGVEIAADEVVDYLTNRLERHGLAGRAPRGGEGHRRAADRDRRPAPHRHDDPLRPPRPGPGAAGPAELGGGPPGARRPPPPPTTPIPASPRPRPASTWPTR